jgi:hypothetical protein
LTIKFTRHTAAPPPAFGFPPSAPSIATTRRANCMGLFACSSRGITASYLAYLAPGEPGIGNPKHKTPPHTSRLLFRHS